MHQLHIMGINFATFTYGSVVSTSCGQIFGV